MKQITDEFGQNSQLTSVKIIDIFSPNWYKKKNILQKFLNCVTSISIVFWTIKSFNEEMIICWSTSDYRFE